MTIKWRARRRSLRVIEGLRRYPDRAAADRQVAIWQQRFPGNTYYVEPVAKCQGTTTSP